jgi:hypothetical protein
MTMSHKIGFVAGIGFALAVSSGAVLAQDEQCSVPMADWQPREAVRKMAEGLGWQVARVKIDDGCYEVFARDAKGMKFEAAVNPGTLEVVRMEYDHDHEKGEKGEHD